MIKFETLKVILPILLPEEQIEMAVFIYLEIRDSCVFYEL